MKVLNKIEQIIITIFCALVLWTTMVVGAYWLFYDSFDMCRATATDLTWLYGIVTGYWLIRKIVFRIIRICKKSN